MNTLKDNKPTIETTKILLTGLPKFSLNQWYAGRHWKFRHKMKQTYALMVRSQCKHRFSKNYKYVVSYNFGFKDNPLDASNCSGMQKLIEDVLFKTDKWDVVRAVTCSSTKHDKDEVLIIVETIKN